jgi:hypothetical protein
MSYVIVGHAYLQRAIISHTQHKCPPADVTESDSLMNAVISLTDSCIVEVGMGTILIKIEPAISL